MSLINDALKKADEAQKTGGAPPPPPIPMRPAKSGTSSFLPVLLLIVFLLAVLGLAAWFFASWWKMNRERLLAKAAAAPAQVAVETNEPAAPLQPTNEVKEPLVATNIVLVTNFVQAKLEGPSLTNILKTLAALRLQGVFYRPPDSTALINGKSVHVGDKIQTVNIVDIGKDRVTVSLSRVTNVLELK